MVEFSLLEDACRMKRLLSVVCLWTLASSLLAADPTPEQRQFQDFVRSYAAKMRAADRVPATKDEWFQQRDRIRRGLENAWNFPDETCPLEPKKLGEEQRDGYRFERLIFQTMPGVWMTAFAYVPDGPGPFPAILQVHGHWKGAKQDPVLQARSIGAAKLGFFVLAVDAFGAGERGLTKNLGEYHGEMVGATLFPIGRPLSGIQVYENLRAVEYLQSRPEVHRDKIGITGASGGGNQSMYAGCYDERFAAVIPCCSVGTYDAYLTTACCMCEVVPTALAVTEEWGVLGLAAPRGLMVINASKDAFQFSIGEARKSLGKVDGVFAVMGRPEQLRHNTYFWHHDYSKTMREAMYGWMAYHLKGEGDGSPIPEPKFETFDPEKIRCFPNGSRPDDWLTLPQFAAREGRKILEKWTLPATKDEWERKAAALKKTLVEKTFGGFPEKTPLNVQLARDESGGTLVRFSPEPGISLSAQWIHPQAAPARTTIVLNLDGADAARNSPLVGSLRNDKANYVVIDLRATGRHAWPADRIMRAPDHNTAQWSMWIGRPLLGQWTYDVVRLIDALEESNGAGLGEIALACQGSAGVVGLCAAAVDARGRIKHVLADGLLASYISDVPYEGQRVGIMAPGIVRDVGDIPHLAALALRTVEVKIVSGTTPDGRPLGTDELRRAFATTTALAELSGRPIVLGNTGR
jgi:dienelactone hydrolase